MKKSKAMISLIVFVLILGLLGYTAVFGVGSDKSGSASSIKLGLDLAGGVSITYQVVGDENPDAEDMNDTIYKLQQRVQNYSTEAQVYQEGADRINIEIPGVSDANAILEELGKPEACILSLRRTVKEIRTMSALTVWTRQVIWFHSTCSIRRSTKC